MHQPRLTGKVERSHPTDEEEFYHLIEGVVLEDAGGFNHKLPEWEHSYNYNRLPSALDGHSPYERLRQKAGLSRCTIASFLASFVNPFWPTDNGNSIRGLNQRATDGPKTPFILPLERSLKLRQAPATLSPECSIFCAKANVTLLVLVS